MGMKLTLYATLFTMFASVALAGGHKEIEDKNGLFVNGTVEIYIDDTNTETPVDTRLETFAGFETVLDHSFVNWAGFGARYDTNYSLDRTLDNTITEKQMGIEILGSRLYLGETDAQRLGFAKTSKIGAPVIITKPSSRIDHNEKVVLTFGGWENNDEFEFNTYRLKRDMPYGGVFGWNPADDSLYYGATARVSILDVSYMGIKKDDETQHGYSVGTSFHRMGVPVGLGIERWEDAENTRMDYGIMYNATKELMFTAHRVEEDDLGFTYNYLAAIHTQGPIELGLYLHHDKSQVSPWTGVESTIDNSIKGTLKYHF
jgi:hypothetical protein